MKSKYTFEYDEKIENLLDRVLGGARAEIEASGIAKFLEFVALAGGYGRGEGGIYQGGLYNDLDFCVITKDCASKSDERKVNEFFEKLSKKIAAQIKIDADFSKAAKLSYVKDRMDVMVWREMAMGSNVVFGDRERFREIFNNLGENTEVSNSEMLKLAMNRLSGLVFAREKILGGDFCHENLDFIARNISKALLACGDISIAARETLPFKVSQRLRAIERGECYSADIKAAYRKAAAFKASPKILSDPKEIEAGFLSAARLAAQTYKDNAAFLARTRSLSRRAKNFLLARMLRPLFGKLGVSNIFRDPRACLAEAAINILENPSLQTPENFKIYKKIWERLS